MTVYEDLLEWAASRPGWQQDALRLLVVRGDLLPDELDRMVTLCRREFGAGDRGDEQPEPLGPEHIPANPADLGAVRLASVEHVCGVNALAENQTVSFKPDGLTVVYGDNGSGKSGYARIIKQLCRARVGEAVPQPDVFAPPKSEQAAIIRYMVGESDGSHRWSGTAVNESPSELSAIAVFDSQCACGYLAKADKPPYAPAGLCVFERLVDVCNRVRTRLNADLNRIAEKPKFGDVAASTTVGRLLAEIVADTPDESVLSAAVWTDGDEAELGRLTRMVTALESKDPKTRARELVFRSSRLERLDQHLSRIESAVSDAGLRPLVDAETAAKTLSTATVLAKSEAFGDANLADVGGEPWRALWQAARRYSQSCAYPEAQFPALHQGTKCVLCQRVLDDQSKERLASFEAFVRSDAQSHAELAANQLRELRLGVSGLKIDDADIEAGLQELEVVNASIAEAIRVFLGAATQRQQAARDDLLSRWGDIPELPPSEREQIARLANEASAEAAALSAEDMDTTRTAIKVQIQELKDRKWLSQNTKAVLEALANLRLRRSLEQCVASTQTAAITRKSSELTKKYVSDALRDAFELEMAALAESDMRVSLQRTEAKQGALLHGVVLNSRTRSTGVERVFSEGECRCVALAAFFAELATASHRSGIVLDDPVCSLDHVRRNRLARRIVQEASRRQVIVFTHDLVFLLQLKEEARVIGAEMHPQHLRRLSNGAGVRLDGLPWDALSVSKRLKKLRNDIQTASAKYRKDDVLGYERDALVIYTLLRQAWERGVEEVLLNGAVQRFERGISTRFLAKVDIEPRDLSELEAGMTKTSRWLHDNSPALGERIPDPAEVEADIRNLQEWVERISSRRK